MRQDSRYPLKHGPTKSITISVNLRITLLLEGFLTPTIMFLTNIGTVYLINSTLKLQTHNPGECQKGIHTVDLKSTNPANPGSDKKEFH